MNGTRRFMALGGLAAVLAIIWAITQWAGEPDYVTLYRDLDLGEAGTMSDGLTKASINFRLANGGAEIQVGTSDLARARVLLAKDGLPTQGRARGYEILDGQQWGMSDFQQRIALQRALEGELARAIAEIKGVEKAKVQLVLPESGALRRLDRPAKASILITVRPGVTMTQEAVQGITEMVSHAVPQLPSENVAVMDNLGRLLSTPADGTGAGLSSRQLDLQHSVEVNLKQKAEKMLAGILGADGARVEVAAQLNFEQVEKQIESVNPDASALLNEQRSETTGDSLDGGGGTSTIVNNTYQNSHTVEKVVGSIGGITRLTVAVQVDDKALAKASGTTGAGPELGRLEGLVRDAIGLDSARGDRITVQSFPLTPEFSVAALGDSAAASSGPGTLVIVERFSRPAIGVIGIIAAVVLAMRVLKQHPAPMSQQGGQLAGVTDAGSDYQLPSVAVPALTMATTKLKNQVQLESAQHPETAAQVVKAWLADS
ncbi:MAG: flagellar basal-body MS-ring/collar protein FliF [Gemmatimonadota bacterium]